MIESLMNDLLQGATKGVAGSFAGGIAKSAVADQSFSEVFASIQQNADSGKKQELATPRAGQNDKNLDKEDDQRAMKADKPEKTEAAQKEEAADEDKPALSDDAIAAKIMARLDKMKAENPDAYAALMENAGQMSMTDFLTQLGFTQDEIGQFAQAMDLDVEVPETLVASLADGDLRQTVENVATLTGKQDAAPIDNIDGDAELVKVDEKSRDLKATVADTRPQELKQDQTAAKETTAVRAENSRQEQSTGNNREQQGQTNGEAKKEVRPQGMVSSLADNESRSAMKEAAINAGKEQVGAKAQADATPAVDQAAKGAERSAAEKLAAAPVQQAAAQAADKAATAAAAPRTGAPSVEASGNANATAKSEGLAPEAAEKAERTANTRRDFERMLMAQVVDKARIGFKANGASQMTMRLDPPHLGKIDMRVMVKDNSMKAVMVAENPEVKAAIEGNLDQLKQQLANAGMKIDELTVTTAGDQRGMAFGQTQADGRNGSNNTASGRGAHGGQETANDDATTPSGRDPRHEGLLSIVA